MPGPATPGRAPHQVHLRAQELRASRPRPAGRGAAPPRLRVQPSRPGKGRWGRGRGCLRPQKRPGAGRRTRSKRSWLPGFLFEQNRRESRAAGVGPGRAPCAREAPAWAAPSTTARAPPGARQAGPLPGTLVRLSAAAGPGRRRPGAWRGGPRGTYGEARPQRRRRRQQQGVRPVPSRPLAPFLSALLTGPPASSLPARAPRARPLRPAPLPSELEPVAAAPGFPQCTARSSSHPIPSPRVRPPLPRHSGAPALTPSSRLRAREPSALCRLDVGGSVPGAHQGPDLWPLPSGAPPGRRPPSTVRALG